jgi:release factor glutamine methyltransferase
VTTYGEALASARASLSEAGVASAALDSRLLLSAAAGLDMAAIIARDRDPMPEVAAAAFAHHVNRRLTGEPVARILGEKEFWGLPFEVGPAVLVPRPDTETLVEAVLAHVGQRDSSGLTICDLGTGSGAILIALLKELPQAHGMATDISEEALSVARQNAERLGVAPRITFKLADFADALNASFHIVVANPPYIRSDEIDMLEPEVSEHDPRAALDGGADGLCAYRAILGRIGDLLAADGLVAFEVGHDQGRQVAGLCRDAQLAEVRVHHDVSGRQRVVTARGTMPRDSAGSRKKTAWKS